MLDGSPLGRNLRTGQVPLWTVLLAICHKSDMSISRTARVLAKDTVISLTAHGVPVICQGNDGYALPCVLGVIRPTHRCSQSRVFKPLSDGRYFRTSTLRFLAPDQMMH
jgi:hypothetical protein